MSRRPGYILGDHWLEVAFDRICAGDGEAAVLRDYGWIPTLTDAEREAVEYYVGTGGPDAVDATLRGLLERTRGAHATPSEGSVPERGTPAETPLADPERDIPPAWMARPFWVDPPQGWRYGFPRLYDRAYDGDMTEWMIANGYPEKLARQNLPCTFTAANDGELAKTDKP